MNLIILFVSCVCLWSVQAGSVPQITKCEWNDDECHKKSTLELIPTFVGGIADLKVEQLDPMMIDFVDASTPNLEFKVRNMQITGLKNCEPKKVRRDKGKSKLFIKLLCTADVVADYVINGKLIVYSLQGDGKMTVNLRKLLINVEMDLIEKNHKDGEKYWSIKSWSHTFELKDKSDIKFTRLVPNNKEIQSTIEGLLATNGNEVITELAPPLILAAAARVIENIQHFMHHMSIKNLALS